MTIRTHQLPSIAAAAFLLLAPLSAAAENWPQWRGPNANGVAPGAAPPHEWSESQNIRWKVPVPGRGSGSPIVWGDRVFVLTAVSESGAVVPGVMHRFLVIAFDRQTGIGQFLRQFPRRQIDLDKFSQPVVTDVHKCF